MRLVKLFDISFIQSDFRPLTMLPAYIKWAVPILLCVQFAWHQLRGGPAAEVVALRPPPAIEGVRAAFLGEDALASRLLLLWLASYDTQPGVSLPYAALDYEQLIRWLDLALKLDPSNQAAMLSATRLYGSVADEGKRRKCLRLSIVCSCATRIDIGAGWQRRY